MAHSFINNNLHCVFSTKERKNLIRPEFQERLWRLIISVAVERGMRIPAIGGIENHIHILLSVPAVMPVAKAIQSIKGVSSKWINEKFPAAGGLHGRRDTARSASARPKLKTQSGISGTSGSIFRNRRSKKNIFCS